MTFLLETIRLGLSNLRLHLLRSVLTALGIILGVAAVIIMVSIGEGSKRAALVQIERLGARNIIVRSQRPPETSQPQQQGGKGRAMSFTIRYGITRDDLEVLKANFADAPDIVPLKEVGGQIIRDDRRRTSQAYGTTPEFPRVANIRVARGGRYLTAADLEDQTRVAVIGSEIAKQFYSLDPPLGSTIRIDEQVFTVVGVLEPVGLAAGAGSALVGRDLDLDIHIPLSTAQGAFGDQIFRRTSGSMQSSEVQLSEVYIASPTRDRVMMDAARIRRIMDSRHADLNDFILHVPYQLLETAEQTAFTYNVIFGFIAGISLLVGGIGIMNIMLATVTERTREIGIRRAIGATRRHILWQFLVETGVLSTLGGLIGIAVGVSLSYVFAVGAPLLPRMPGIGRFFNPGFALPTHVAPWSIGLAFTVAVLTGLVFGIYPARRAAAQDPIVALRHD